MIIRTFDFILSFVIFFLFFPLLIIIYIIGLFDSGQPLFFHKRIGLNFKTFTLIKFRTMKVNTPISPTHLINKSSITPFGYFLRKFKLDELPQLVNVLIGDMSLVGPRPCLPNQKKLIKERKKKKIFLVKPGISGLAQISGITMETPIPCAKTDLKMIKKMNLFYYFYYILMTTFLIFKKRS